MSVDRALRRAMFLLPGKAGILLFLKRVRRLIRAGLMTPAGLAKIQIRMGEPFVIPADILRLLKKDATTWKTFQALPDWYR